MLKIITTAFVAVAALPAVAVPLTGTGGAENALVGTLVDFEGETAGRYTTLTIGGVTFAGDAGSEFGISSGFGGSFNTRGRQYLENTREQNSFTVLNVTFAAPTGAFAFNFGANDDDWNLAAYDSDNNLIESLTIPPLGFNNNGEYFGFSAPGIKWFQLSLNPCSVDCPIDYVLFDNLVYVEATGGIPEPATWAMMIAGFGLVGAAVRRRKATVSA